MNLLVHAGAGVLVGQATGNPILAFICGLISHIILDVIPHGDSHMYKRYKNKELSMKKAMAGTMLDAIATVIFVILIFNLGIYHTKLVTSMALIGAIIPDVLIGIYELSLPNAPKFLRVIHKWHFKNHDLIAEQYDLSFKNGLLLQVVFLLIFLVAL